MLMSARSRLYCAVQSLALVTALATWSAASAEAAAEFYKGSNLELDISSSVGGGYDAYARMLARHIGRFIPGSPIVVAKNMEGVGGLRLANFLYNAAPRDGTTFATLYRGIVFDPLLGGNGAQFEAIRFTYIGSANDEVSVCVAWHTTGVISFEQVLTKELVVGASGRSADTYQFPKIVNGVLGTKFRIIAGYPGGNDIDLAMDRGEVQGRCGWSWTSLKATRQSWLAEKKINILFQMGLSRHPDLPSVPLVMDLARNDDDKAILKLIFARQVMARPYIAPPDVPNNRAEALRAAFADTMKDGDFLADAEKSLLEIRSVSGEDVEKLVKDVYQTPPAIVRRAADILR
jgi:tripartite-type tricarboxylate transporter receptor subunit TctC